MLKVMKAYGYGEPLPTSAAPVLEHDAGRAAQPETCQDRPTDQDEPDDHFVVHALTPQLSVLDTTGDRSHERVI